MITLLSRISEKTWMLTKYFQIDNPLQESGKKQSKISYISCIY
jgi:hypothetical protein